MPSLSVESAKASAGTGLAAALVAGTAAGALNSGIPPSSLVN